MNKKAKTQIFNSSTAEETKKIARKIAQNFLEGGVVTLSGPLGSGKTTFSQGFAEGLGISQKVISPTFILIRQYLTEQKKTLYHLDLYRLHEDKSLLDNIGIEEILADHNNIMLIEWPELIKDLIPLNALKISLEQSSDQKIDPNLRKIVITCDY